MKKILQSTLERHSVSWLELFYDLIYVVVIAKLAHLITSGHGGHLRLSDFVVFIALFIPVWWAWTGHTLYATRFYDDSVIDRLFTLVQMFLVTLMALFITDAFHGNGQQFALTYAGIRGLLVAMYIRVYFSNPDLRPVASCLSWGFGIGVLCWSISAFLPPPWMYGLWVTGLLIELITPLRCRPQLKLASVHSHHLPERFGLFTIILLGESVSSLTSGLSSHDLSLEPMIIALLGFASLSAIWWHYFEVVERVVMNKELGAGQLLIYGHLPIFIGLVLLAAAIRHNIIGNLNVADISLLFSVGLMLYLIPVQFIAQLNQIKEERWPLQRNTILLVTVLVAVIAARNIFNAIGISSLITTIMVVYVIANTPKRAPMES